MAKKKNKKKPEYIENCANCKYWGWEKNGCPCEVDSAECHRFPPHIPTPEGRAGKCPYDEFECVRCFACGIGYTQGPVTFADNWCGEFKMSKHPFIEWSEDYEED